MKQRSGLAQGLAQAELDAAALGSPSGSAGGAKGSSGSAGAKNGSGQHNLSGSLRQIQQEKAGSGTPAGASAIGSSTIRPSTSRQKMYSTYSHGSPDDDDSLEDEIEGAVSATHLHSSFPNLPSQQRRQGSSSRLHSSLPDNLQSDLNSSPAHILFGSGLENMGHLHDLDSHDLDRMHTGNKKATLVLRNLADGRHGSESGDLDGISGGGINDTSPAAVRERANFLLELADDSMPLSRAHVSSPHPQPTSSSSSHSPFKEKLSGTASQIGQVIGKASAKVTHKIHGGGDADDAGKDYDDDNLDYGGFGSRSLNIDAIYHNRRYADSVNFDNDYSPRQARFASDEVDIAPTKSRAMHPRVMLALMVGTAVFIVSVYDAFKGFGAPAAAAVGGGKGGGVTSSGIGVKSPHSHDEEARVNAIKHRLRDSGIVGDIDCKGDGPPTPQCRAVRWLSLEDPKKVAPDDEYILQRYALAVFWYSTFGLVEQQEAAHSPQSWTEHDGWMTGAGICSWFGIICHPQPGTDPNTRNYDGDGEVTHLRMPKNNIKGTIPREVFYLLTEMIQLDLSENTMSGTLSEEIQNMKFLEYLYLYSNVMTGSVPASIGNCIDMLEIDLGDNKLSGSVPSSIGQLRSLSLLSMYGNLLTGSIPNDVGNLGLLEVLYLDNNKLDGTIPDDLFKLSKLYDLRINKNELGGTIPESVGDPVLELLYLDSNQLEGFIPKSLSRHERLADLRLYSNRLIGPMPSEFSNLKSLDHLSLEYNSLQSTIPPEWRGLTHLSELYVQGNRITGIIPTELGVLSNLKGFMAHDNLISGTIPTEVGKLYRLNNLSLENNKLQGTLPTQIAKLEKLVHLKVDGNVITGVVDNQICELTKVSLQEFSADCDGKSPDIVCSCCTECL